MSTRGAGVRGHVYVHHKAAVVERFHPVQNQFAGSPSKNARGTLCKTHTAHSHRDQQAHAERGECGQVGRADCAARAAEIEH